MAVRGEKSAPGNKGFTLIELLITVAVLALLSTFIILKSGRLIRRANEGTARANLGILRIAVMNYYGINNGEWPEEPLSKHIIPDYISSIPYIQLSHHAKTNQMKGPEVTDSGQWAYNAETGKVFIDCTHRDLDGVPISVW